jgi:hypothetical protein
MEEGKKFDQGKPNWFLLPMESIGDVVKVLTFGASKYGKGNWKRLADWEERYFSATMRHLEAWQSGENKDPESGLPHLAHAATNIIFMLWFSKSEAVDKAKSNFNNVFDLTHFGS